MGRTMPLFFLESGYLMVILVFKDEPFSQVYIPGVRVAALPDFALLEERGLSLGCPKLNDSDGLVRIRTTPARESWQSGRKTVKGCGMSIESE